ncbi:hypothetical protein ZWY2020_009059 [Hordeum vulgare]|nr:hypothetical protein ZWY2020_009059 [Hordeum vulgare]
MGRTSYIRIKHEEERREASSDWENPNGQVFSTTKDTDVAARLVELRNQILIGSASFADLALAPPPCRCTKLQRHTAGLKRCKRRTEPGATAKMQRSWEPKAAQWIGAGARAQSDGKAQSGAR